MAAASWPASLPGFNQDGYGEQLGSGTIRTQMDSGPDNTRRRYTAVPDQVTTNLVLTGTEYETLKAFYRTTLAEGSLPFDYEQPRTESAVEMRFIAPPNIASAAGGDKWNISVSVEVLP